MQVERPSLGGLVMLSLTLHGCASGEPASDAAESPRGVPGGTALAEPPGDGPGTSPRQGTDAPALDLDAGAGQEIRDAVRLDAADSGAGEVAALRADSSGAAGSLTAADSLAGSLPADAGREFGQRCIETLQAEAFKVAVAASECETGDTCEIVHWESFLGRRPCVPALACYGFISSRADRAALASAARALAEAAEACGVCGTAGCISLAGKRAVCDTAAHRCVLVDALDAGPGQ